MHWLFVSECFYCYIQRIISKWNLLEKIKLKHLHAFEKDRKNKSSLLYVQILRDLHDKEIMKPLKWFWCKTIGLRKSNWEISYLRWYNLSWQHLLQKKLTKKYKNGFGNASPQKKWQSLTLTSLGFFDIK